MHHMNRIIDFKTQLKSQRNPIKKKIVKNIQRTMKTLYRACSEHDIYRKKWLSQTLK